MEGSTNGNLRNRVSSKVYKERRNSVRRSECRTLGPIVHRETGPGRM